MIDSKNIKPEDVAAVSAAYWAQYNHTVLQGGAEFDISRHPYQVKPMNSRAKRRMFKKAAQLGISELEILKTLHGMIHGQYPKGVLYLFPTSDDVIEFSKVRFAPLISDNPLSIGRFVQDTNTASVKKINRAILYLRGARSSQRVEGLKKDSSKLRSIPVDKIVEDERDLMEHEMIEMAQERLSHSEVAEEVGLSTPTIPDYGIDREYENSDQQIWVIKCPQCGRESCLELDFPDCVQQWNDGKYRRGCIQCGHELNPMTGQWVVRESSRETEGYWISQLNSSYVDPGKILQLYLNPPNGNLQEVMNSKLGMAYIASENKLTRQDVYACMGNEIPPLGHKGPTAMGVDVGNDFHITILDRPNDKSLRLVKAMHVTSNKMDDFTPLHDIAAQYNVHCMVIDFAPVQQKVRAFREGESYEVFGCIYQQHQRGPAMWDSEQGIVRINRTEVCDATHQLVTEGGGRLLMPRRTPDLEEYAKQMCNIAKVLEEDEETGSRDYRYRKLGADHYRHSLNYAYLASQRIGVVINTSPTGSGAKLDRVRSTGSWQSA